MAVTQRLAKFSNVEYHAKLQIWVRFDGRDWLAWCPSIDVMTQARTRKRALQAIREAVEGWFESCIESNTLDKALAEVGFLKNSPGADFAGKFDQVTSEPGDASQRTAKRTTTQRTLPVVQASLPGQGRREPDCVEVSIPAFVAAPYLEGASAPG